MLITYVSVNFVIIGSGNGSVPVQCQTIAYTSIYFLIQIEMKCVSKDPIDYNIVNWILRNTLHFNLN